MDRTDPESPLTDSRQPLPQGRRLPVDVLPEVGAEVELGAAAARHARVLRIASGDHVQLFDGQGGSALASVSLLTKEALRCRVLALELRAHRTQRVVLVQCLPKTGKLDDIVRMTTELGVAQIVMAISEHCVARASQREEHRIERLARIAREAARQSEQPFVPEIVAARPLAEVIASAPASAFRVACVERTAQPLPAVIDASDVWLVVGPEGGLSAGDRALLASGGFAAVALGRSILRTETAAVVGVAFALERLGRCG